jgi:DnaK suppressor protein
MPPRSKAATTEKTPTTNSPIKTVVAVKAAANTAKAPAAPAGPKKESGSKVVAKKSVATKESVASKKTTSVPASSATKPKGTVAPKVAVPEKKAAPAKKVAPAASAAAPEEAPTKGTVATRTSARPVAERNAPAKAVAKKSAPAVAKARVLSAYASDTKFIDRQKAALLDERATYLEQAQSLKAEAEALVLEMEPGDIQFDDESGEGGTATVDRERDLALSAQALAAVEEIDEALVKIARGTYGICEGCGELISKPRLEALPYAKLCIACKSGGLSRR